MAISDSSKAGQNDYQNKEDAGSARQAGSQEAYDVGFMIEDQDDLVDLDSLFDALNVAAEKGVDAIGYVSGPGENTGVLTVTNEALAVAGVSASMDDVNAVLGHSNTDPVISDES